MDFVGLCLILPNLDLFLNTKNIILSSGSYPKRLTCSYKPLISLVGEANSNQSRHEFTKLPTSGPTVIKQTCFQRKNDSLAIN
jgi:hypothetical protein